MIAQLNLYVGALTSRQGTVQVLQRIAQEVPFCITGASSNDIRLKVIDAGRLGDPSEDGALSTEALHLGLQTMTGYQQYRNKVSNIGILVADAFAPAPTCFGLMFDDAFQPSSSNQWESTPREGCAIFLDAIAKGRPSAQQMDEAIFTTIHELGHVFNLQHSASPSYMHQSATDGFTQLAHASFSDHEKWLLEQCSTSPNIWPGGSGFGDLGTLADSDPAAESTNAPPVELRIAVSQEAFWAFEPVELDVALTRINAKPVMVPDALDAGYRCFDIWIQEPDGERRRLKSPKHFCAPRGKLRINSSHPFRRDISLFGQAGGYTFRKAGVHKVWATFEYRQGKAVVSNTVEVEVLADWPGLDYFDDALSLLSSHEIGRLLFYRRLTTQRMRKLKRLEDFCEAYARRPATAMVRYAMGRALASAATMQAPDAKDGSHLKKMAINHLQASMRRRQLGEHRLGNAEQALETLSKHA